MMTHTHREDIVSHGEKQTKKYLVIVELGQIFQILIITITLYCDFFLIVFCQSACFCRKSISEGYNRCITQQMATQTGADDIAVT